MSESNWWNKLNTSHSGEQEDTA